MLERAAVPVVLVAATAALAGLTTAGRPAPAPPPAAVAPAPAPPSLRLGAPTPTGALAYRPAADGQLAVAAIDRARGGRWREDLDPGAGLPVCGPCPAAWVVAPTGVTTRTADGVAAGPPDRLAPEATVRTHGIGQPVLEVGDDRGTTLWTMAADGPRRLAPAPPGLLDDPRTRVAAATDGTAVTVVGPHPDPLRLAEAQVHHLVAGSTTTVDVAVPDATTRIHPCTAASSDRWGYLLASLGDRPGRERAALVVHGPDGEQRTELPTFLDACTVGPTGDLAWTTTVGRPGGPVAEVDAVVVRDGRVDARSRSLAHVPGVAADASRAQLVVASPDGSARLTAAGWQPLPPADAVAIDPAGGTWLADAEPLAVRRLPPPEGAAP